MNNIAKIRNELQLKRKTLAQLSGISEKEILKLEEGDDEDVSVVVFEKLAAAMNVKVEDFFVTPEQTEYVVAVRNLESNTNGIKKALRKNVELLAQELWEHPEMTDEKRFKIAGAISDYAAMLLKVDSIDEYIREEK